MTVTRSSMRHGVSSRSISASIASPTPRRLPESKKTKSSRAKSRAAADLSATVAACVLWLFIEAVSGNALCDESDTHARDSVATENGHTTAQAKGKPNESLPVSQVVETTTVEQRQIPKRGREKVDALAGRLPLSEPSDASQDQAAAAQQCAPARERTQVLEHEHEWDKAEALARALTSSLRGEVEAVRSAAEAEGIKHRKLLAQEQDRANALARDLATLETELKKTRVIALDAVQGPDAELEHKRELEQERDRADALARELTSVRAECDAARVIAQTAETESKQKQALQQAIKQERDKANVLARELTSAEAERDAARAIAQTAEAESKQRQALQQAIKQELDKAETLTQELATARKNAEDQSLRLAAANAEILQITETNKAVAADQQLALATERDRAETLARKLTSAKEELVAGKQHIAALSVVRARHSRGPAACSPQERTVSELPAPETPSATHEATSNFIPRASVGTERSTSVSAAPSSLVDGPNWIIAETTSLVDHKPQIAALTTAQASSKDAPYSLTIYCRHDRTGLTITASSSWKQSTDGEIKVVYQINEDPSVEQRWRASESGRSLDFSGDVVRLLRSMPDAGRMLFRVYAGEDLLPEITFQLAGLDSVRRKIAGACDWPQP